MSGTTYTDLETAWRFEYEAIPDSGLVLRNVSHDNYRLARDIRVVAAWVSETSPEDPNKPGIPRKLRLGGAALPQTAAPAIGKMPLSPTDFGFYRMLTGVSATYEAAIGPGSHLSIFQEFQFGPWGMNPPHEPGGVLNAARFLPLLSFQHTTEAGGTPVRYIRIDYRLNHALDAFDPSPIVLPTRSPNLNQAGVFRDNEGIPSPMGPRAKSIIEAASPIRRAPDIRDVFAAAEKPLQYEIVAKGLVHGIPQAGNLKSTWDNIHQWPKTEVLPTTPGAFHACHTHWRWGAISGAPPNLFSRRFIPGAGTQFRGLGWTSSQGGPLLDHRVPDQSITFAITTDADPSRAPEVDGSTHPFASRFTGIPTPVSVGANLIQWFCIEVFRTPADTAQVWEGTVFIHGLFFAHSIEPGGLQARLGRLADPVLQPKPTQTWQRGAA